MYVVDAARRKQREREQAAAPAFGAARGAMPRIRMELDETVEGEKDAMEDDGDRRLRALYGKTKKEMHDAYIQRASQWIQTAPTQFWAPNYAKDMPTCKPYEPRQRFKDKEIGNPVIQTGPYSPRAVFQGGGACVRTLPTPSASMTHAPPLLGEYQPPIRRIEKARDKSKEIQPPISIPKNKSLACGHYFVRDVLCTSIGNSNDNDNQHSLSMGSRESPLPATRSQMLSPLPVAQESSPQGRTNMPPTTAEYVASPQWRRRDRQKEVAGEFVSTVQSTSTHTAQTRSITGAAHSPTVLIADPFVPLHKRHVPSESSVRLDQREHERRAQTAATTLRERQSPRRADKMYFRSMWSEEVSSPTMAAPSPGYSSPCNKGRALVLQLAAQSQRRATCSPRRA